MDSFDSQAFLQTFSERLISLTSSLSRAPNNSSPSNTTRNFLVAYSGGMDSHVLLQLLSDLSKQTVDVSVRALHVHHGLLKEADAWVKHCQSVCDGLGVSLEVIHLNLKVGRGESIEAVARQGRYRVLSKALQKDEVLLTGHHQRDQAETLLLQLFRGAGVQGLAAMPVVANFAKSSGKEYRHIRPLLPESYQSLKAYARDNLLNFIEDPSNQDNSFERNFLRNQILPQLREHWQGIDKTISRSASIQSETKLLLDELAEETMLIVKGDKKNTLSVNDLLELSVSRMKLVLRYWLTQQGFKAPSEKKLSHIMSDVLLAKEDAQPLVQWQGVEIRRYKNQLYCLAPLPLHDNKQVISWDGRSPLVLENLGVTVPLTALNALGDLPVQKHPVTVRFRQGGEKLVLANKSHSQSLKKLLNDAGVAPWLRDRIPLIYAGDRLIHIVGLEG
ncbi:MAG TPA: tRNA lysidine(34) synthetase TilS [Leucothrix sp.]|nr:tRNA lysidine(34) synthetase TilS [Leucothrix sp.]